MDFKPLHFAKPTEVCEDTVIETDETVTIKSWLYDEREVDGTEVCTTFTLADIVLEETVLAGYTTSHYFKMGIVTGWSEGKYFYFDGPNEGSLLWNRLMIVKGPLADKARERYETSKHPERHDYLPPPMKRTDSGTNYCHPGFPDLEFWERSGIQPWFVVPYPYNFEHDIKASEEAYEMYKSWLMNPELTVIQRRALAFTLSELRPIKVLQCLARTDSAEDINVPPPLPQPASDSPHWPLEPPSAPRQGADGESGPFIGLEYERAILLAKRMKKNPTVDPYVLLANETLTVDVMSFTEQEVIDGLSTAFGLTMDDALAWRSAKIDEALYD